MRIADAVADWLVEKNILTVYGIIGGGNHVLFDAISQKGEVKIVCCHHEQACVMASNAHNRIEGTLRSVALVTTGAGSTNAITGVMAAWMDNAPLIVLSGNENSKYINSLDRVWGVQGYGSSEMVRKCTVYSARASQHVPITAYLMGAYDAAIRNHGPAWIDIPKDVQSA